MDPKLLLVKIMTLLYKESVSSDKSVRSDEIVKGVIDTIKLPDTGMDFAGVRETLQALRATALWMASAPAGHVFDKASLLQRVRINASEDDSLYQAFAEAIATVEDGEELQREVSDARSELRAYITQTAYREYIKKLYQASMFNDGTANFRQIARDAVVKLEEFAGSGTESAIPGMLYSFDLDDTSKTEQLFQQAAEETASEGILRTGWQALNRMTGDHFGFRRGEMIVVGALQHNFKTGFTMSIFEHVALYNKPYMRDKTKKPCLLHISTENDPHINLMWLYANLMENETGVECDLSPFKDPDITVRMRAIEHASKYIQERMTVNGYTIKMMRMDPSETTIYSIVDVLNRLASEGFEIHLMVFDYLNMCNKAGCMQTGPTGADVRDLYRRLRNVTAYRGITVVTPHQLSTEAKALVRMGTDNFVGEIANKGYYDGCKTIDQEVDMEIYIHIEKLQGRSYLTVQRGKHRRSGKITPEQDLYFVLPFQPVGCIPVDLDKKDSSFRTLRGAGGSGEDGGWWDVSANSASGGESSLPVAA